MMQPIKKIAILTGGGDCPGLNAVIRAVTRTAILKYGYEVIGYKFGYRGLYNNDFVKLDLDSVSGILHRGGTILHSSNKDNLFDYQVEDENGKIVKKDVSDVGVENLKKELYSMIEVKEEKEKALYLNMLSQEEVAQKLGTTKQHISTLRELGLIQAIKTGKGFMFSEREIERFQEVYRGCDVSNSVKAIESYKERGTN